MTSISDITATKLQKGEYTALLPELYELQKITENGIWHVHQTVFDHVVKVVSSYEALLRFDFLSPEQKKKIEGYLDKKIDTHTQKDILTLTVLLHDIAKSKTLITHSDGSASCPGHELIGASMMKQFFARFELSDAEADRLERMVRYHGFVSEIIGRIAETHDVDNNRLLFQDTVGDIALDLLLFIYSDLHGADLEQTQPQVFSNLATIQRSYISDLATAL